MISYKQKCMRCKKNSVLVTSRTRFVLCYDCQKDELKGEIKDPEMKKLFDIPEDYYKNNAFIRSIKANYLRHGELTEKQILYFKKSVEEMGKKKEQPPIPQY